MAEFRTHLTGALIVTGASTVAALGLGLAPKGQAPILLALGTVGGLLPDIDAAGSAPVRGFFGVLGALLAFAWTMPLAGIWSPLGLGLAWCASFLCVRLLLCELFARFAVHRGVWHSWLAASTVSLAGVVLVHRILHWPSDMAWLGGAMVGIGYLTHLILDEVSSVDLAGIRVRRSFGTALKPLGLSSPWPNLGMLTCALALLLLAPLPSWAPEPIREFARHCHWPCPAGNLAPRLKGLTLRGG